MKATMNPFLLLIAFATFFWSTVAFVPNRFFHGSIYCRASSTIASSTTTMLHASLVDDQQVESSIDASSSSNKKIGSITFLIPSNADSITSKFGEKAPVDNPSLLEAVQHLANKASWFADGLVDTDIVVMNKSSDETFQKLVSTDVLLAMGLTSDHDLEYAARLFDERQKRDATLRQRQCQFALECGAKQLPATVGPYKEQSPSLQSTLLPWTQDATAKRLHQQMMNLFQRWTSDEFVLAIMLFLNQYSGSQIDWVKHSIDATWEKGPIRNAQEIYEMISKCGDCIGACVADDSCRNCIGTLTKLDTRDQVASYRTIVSFESDLLKDFTLCILTKNNIFKCDAKIPTLPKVEPIKTWRGKPLTEEGARQILVAHLDDEAAPEGGQKLPVSWKVVCGANEAYDKFPSQNQLFYPAAKGRDMWYDPVFRVETLDGRNIWCKRHYKVRPQKVPGTFRFSVLDNGVTSDEFWTIAGVADDLSWVVFHYAGAASAAGQRYLGGLLCTPDGKMPDESKMEEIWKAVRSAGIQPWEYYVVDNDTSTPAAKEAGEPPLNYYRDAVLASRARAASKNE